MGTYGGLCGVDFVTPHFTVHFLYYKRIESILQWRIEIFSLRYEYSPVQLALVSTRKRLCNWAGKNVSDMGESHICTLVLLVLRHPSF